ncbi:MAG: hypothetical protein ACI9BD_001106, partial [Candidatus Marinamargulisbacteria bacterium]
MNVAQFYAYKRVGFVSGDRVIAQDSSLFLPVYNRSNAVSSACGYVVDQYFNVTPETFLSIVADLEKIGVETGEEKIPFRDVCVRETDGHSRARIVMHAGSESHHFMVDFLSTQTNHGGGALNQSVARQAFFVGLQEKGRLSELPVGEFTMLGNATEINRHLLTTWGADMGGLRLVGDAGFPRKAVVIIPEKTAAHPDLPLRNINGLFPCGHAPEPLLDSEAAFVVNNEMPDSKVFVDLVGHSVHWSMGTQQVRQIEAMGPVKGLDHFGPFIASCQTLILNGGEAARVMGVKSDFDRADGDKAARQQLLSMMASTLVKYGAKNVVISDGPDEICVCTKLGVEFVPNPDATELQALSDISNGGRVEGNAVGCGDALAGGIVAQFQCFGEPKDL